MVKAGKFSTCQCPATDGGEPGTLTFRAGRKREERRDGNGNLIAVTCARCMMPIELICRACGVSVPDVEEHMKRAEGCGIVDKVWRANKARSVGMRVTKAAEARTGKLFPDDVLDPKKKSKAFHR